MGSDQKTDSLSRLFAHVLKVGLEDSSCHQLVLVINGAHWIWEQSAGSLRVAGKGRVEILELGHASQHIWAVAHAAWKALPVLSVAGQKIVTTEQAYLALRRSPRPPAIG